MDINILSKISFIISGLQQEINTLKEKVNTTSENSSIPPSKSYKKKKKVNHKKSERTVGAQPGHKGNYREMLSSEQVDNIKALQAPTICKKCNNELKTLNKVYRHQVYDIVDSTLKVTEYQLKKSKCLNCRKIYRSNLPPDVSTKILGPNISALITSLVVNYHLSKQKVINLLQDLYGFRISKGSISNIEKTVSSSLEQAYDNCHKQLNKEVVLNADETRHIEKADNQYLWIGANSNLTVFLFDKSRGKKAAKKLLGENFNGVLISDRYVAYNFKEPDERQCCWAHLKRDFLKISQRPGEPGKIGKELLFYKERIFYFWHLYKNNKITFNLLYKIITPIKEKLLSLLKLGANLEHKKTANTCKNILKLFNALWTFTKVEGVEPTNNHAEQQLSFGTKSKGGTLYLQRAFTIIATCRKQSKNVINYIAECIKAFAANHDPPLIFK